MERKGGCVMTEEAEGLLKREGGRVVEIEGRMKLKLS